MNNISSLFNLSPGSTHTYTSQSSLLNAMTYSSSTHTYTATSDMEYNNTSTALTLSSNGYTYKFLKLYVNGDFTLNGTTTTTATSLYVNGDFTISGPTSTNQFGPLYVDGTASFKGPSSGRLGVKTTSPQTTTVNGTVMASPTVAGPMYAVILSVDGNLASGSGNHHQSGSGGNDSYDGSSGATDLVLGDVWLDGDAGTGDVACNFSGPSSGTASTVMCPLLATTEKTVSNGLINVGTLTNPMVYYMQCDNDQLYSNTCAWASTGQYYGLMILFEASITISGNSGVSTPNVVGSVLEGTPNSTDITLSGTSSVCYNQTVVDNCTSDSLKTTQTNTVPGTWQQLSTN